MRSFSLLLFIAPAAVFGVNITFGRGNTGLLCCDRGAPGPSKTCTGLKLNSYGCIDSPADDDFGGCDGITNWPIGRDVKAFEPGSVVSHTQAETFNIEVGFVGCAK
ncbi:hypothetical protein MCOR27_006059 [Pyricularia oryzae]|uniref:Uncharacterized protein n=2 Tax=Pyricularia TaxID=48558 RepID=A0ABQ8NB94_PYRGI|nr:hypothetical protein MCOR01_003941 [Pyricularia oryzae]KAI6294305.1 hypothetical protein MCOR33_008550 [Pyricularia grisea]KAH9430569.1 hypothetical protein MCOR02_007904 [Pyricularia oryzae]KAI6254262.1 hypothetical protein MCOR19_009209 [Pyricularia oryzae]KAI6274293.1 hypothetical protein MCOR26_006535 [Pyricularia oryzae]